MIITFTCKCAFSEILDKTLPYQFLSMRNKGNIIEKAYHLILFCLCSHMENSKTIDREL